MAKVDLFQSPGNGTFLFYNLDASVGKGGANRRDDVLMVQYLIKVSANVPGKFLATVGGVSTVAAGKDESRGQVGIQGCGRGGDRYGVGAGA